MWRCLPFVMALAAGLAAPASAEDARAAASTAAQASPQVTAPAAKPVIAKRARRTLDRGRKSYGFLPGYEPPPDNTRPDYRRNARSPYADGRYWSWGRWYYGWGQPGYVRGRWNGGSIGPCWKSTPVGYAWICG